METLLAIIASVSGFIAALAAVVTVYLDWRRHHKANAETDTPVALRGLSHDARQLLQHVQSRSLVYELSAK